MPAFFASFSTKKPHSNLQCLSFLHSISKQPIMKKALIYDDNCPLCVWYTGLFVKTKLLQKRIAFSEVSSRDLERIDILRSKHEIPLLDLEGGETLYGLDSLVEVLNVKIPFLKSMMHIPFVRTFFYWLYQLISYNRRLIVGKKGCNNGFDCTPDFNLRFRTYYLAISFLVSVVVISMFTQVTAFPMIFIISLIIGLSFTAPLFLTANLKQRYLYYGQYSTIILIGALVLLPSLFCSIFFDSIPPVFWILNLSLSFLLMIKEGIRRMEFIRVEKVLIDLNTK